MHTSLQKKYSQQQQHLPLMKIMNKEVGIYKDMQVLTQQLVQKSLVILAKNGNLRLITTALLKVRDSFFSPGGFSSLQLLSCIMPSYAHKSTAAVASDCNLLLTQTTDFQQTPIPCSEVLGSHFILRLTTRIYSTAGS